MKAEAFLNLGMSRVIPRREFTRRGMDLDIAKARSPAVQCHHEYPKAAFVGSMVFEVLDSA